MVCVTEMDEDSEIVAVIDVDEEIEMELDLEIVCVTETLGVSEIVLLRDCVGDGETLFDLVTEID